MYLDNLIFSEFSKIIGIINQDFAILNDAYETMNKKEEIIKYHCEKICNITQGKGKDTRWFTYVKIPDASKKSGYRRKQIILTKLESVQNEVYKFYIEQQKKEQEQAKITLEKLYPEWLEYKMLQSYNNNNANRLDNDWHKYYINDRIIKQDIRKFKRIDLKTWALQKVRENNLTRRQFSNMSIIIRQLLDYALDKEYIDINPYLNIKLNPKLFKKEKRKTSETEIFFADEKRAIIKLAYEDFLKKKEYTIPLGIILNFYLGLRLGELVALKQSDRKGNSLTVQRSEVRLRNYLPEEKKWAPAGFVVSDYLKAGKESRNIYLTIKARKVFDLIIKANKMAGYTGDFLFVHDGQRVHERAADYRLRKYCIQAGIPVRSMHKIRKTYISTLLDTPSISPDHVRLLAGHNQLSTTYNSYYFSTQREEDTHDALEEALN